MAIGDLNLKLGFRKLKPSLQTRPRKAAAPGRQSPALRRWAPISTVFQDVAYQSSGNGKERPVAFGVVVRGDGFARSCSIGDGPLHLGGTRLGARGAPEIDLHEQLPPEARLICSVLKKFDPNLRIRKIQVRSQWSGRAAVPPALAEIDENLMRADLMAAERAKALKARKKAYQDAHPETKRGGDRKSKAITATNCRTPFTADTAAKTGRSRKSVERDLRGLLPSPRCPARQRGFFGQPTGPF